MRTETPPVIRLEDYRPSDHLIDRVELDIRLTPSATRVTAKLALRPNPAGRADAPLALDGDGLRLVALELDGAPLPGDAYAATPDRLTLASPPPRPFALTIETLLDPGANTKLMGLYRTAGVYCTQCEADGFRRITYFLDRPDVLSVYTTRIEASRDEAPVLLGNGNPVAAGTVAGTDRHYAIWHDPHPKPAYLFALVAGRLGKVERSVTTSEGRAVDLAVYVEPGKEARAHYALDAVARAMRWDEEAFGRAYDLDVFNVVAVADFNMGAMENKGLNIFNDKYVLTSPDTATDQDHANVETIVAHEYFHNWSGNRVTCRDWFQLCLKEGLTVFRDQEFSSDTRSRAVHRIGEVRNLRARQFPEDAGPLAHPVRPSAYAEVNNFYTATVYDKGAEIVRMLRTLLGPAAFRAGMDRYFADNDGTAATVEDFLEAFATASGRDLARFARWYARAGTPSVALAGHYDATQRTYRLDIRQSSSGPEADAALVIPIALGLVCEDGPVGTAGERVHEGLFVLDAAADSILFTDVARSPVPSVLRGFSAPVRVEIDLADEERLILLRHDHDAFNRWEAAQSVAMRIMIAQATGRPDTGGAGRLADALGAFLDAEAERDPALAAQMLTLPGEGDVAGEIGAEIDPDTIFSARCGLRAVLGRRLAGSLTAIRERLAEPDGAPYSPDAGSAGRRSLRNVALDLLAAGDPAAGERAAQDQLSRAGNLTDRLAALATLTPIAGAARETALAAFERRYRDEALILDKWFALQATIPESCVIDRIAALRSHPAFSLTNPNRVRALIGAFALGNPTQFHRADGAGYDLLAEAVITLDRHNPQIAAKLATAFSSWRRMTAGRRARAEAALHRISEARDLSRDVADIVGRTLGK